MVEVIHDDEGKIIAYIDMTLRDIYGNPDPIGEYMYIHEMWIHESIRYTKAWKQFLYNAIKEFPLLKYVYWVRRKHNGRSKTCTIQDLKRRCDGR